MGQNDDYEDVEPVRKKRGAHDHGVDEEDSDPLGALEETQECQFQQELFTILKGKATEIDWFRIDVRIREVVSEVLVSLTDKL